MNQFTKPETAKAGARRARELVANWQPDDVTGDYSGPYYVYERVPVRGCYLRWQHARDAAQSERARRDFVRRCAAWSLSLATGDDLARVPLGAASPN